MYMLFIMIVLYHSSKYFLSYPCPNVSQLDCRKGRKVAMTMTNSCSASYANCNPFLWISFFSSSLFLPEGLPFYFRAFVIYSLFLSSPYSFLLSLSYFIHLIPFRSTFGPLRLVCDECGLVYHMDCLSPPLTHHPSGSFWFCPLHIHHYQFSHRFPRLSQQPRALKAAITDSIEQRLVFIRDIQK